jgi:transcriptional regulator with XRE-family HTH domain
VTRQTPSRLTSKQVDREIGRRIRRHRLTLKMKRSELAAASGVTSRQVREFESGVGGIPAATLVCVAWVLDTAPASLLPCYVEEAARTAATLGPLDLDAGEMLWLFTAIRSKERRQVILDLITRMGDCEPATSGSEASTESG